MWEREWEKQSETISETGRKKKERKKSWENVMSKKMVRRQQSMNELIAKHKMKKEKE